MFSSDLIIRRFETQAFSTQATIASDNHLRIYECLEQPSLLTWQLIEEVDVLSLPSTSPGARSISQTVTQATPTLTSSTLEGASVSLVAHALQQQQQNQAPGRPGMGNREVSCRFRTGYRKRIKVLMA